tara:strand:+ start:407 stop:604 length:198 start_codon:yes stop_codon:yes gene_type:complete
LGVLGLLYNWLRVALFKALFTDVVVVSIVVFLGNIPITRGITLDANKFIIVYNFVVTVVFKVVHV